MPTFVHKDTGKRIFFAHIPRTAGRFVEANLLANGFEWGDSHMDTGLGVMSVVNGVEIAHYHREHYQKYLNVSNIPHFSIVRNPITKFISGSIYLKRTYGDDIQSVMEDPIMFPSMIQNLPFDGAWNWYRPQVDFLTNNTNIWYFENKIGDKFTTWLSDIIGINLKFKHTIDYPKSGDEENKLKLTPALEKIIRSCYKRDYEVLFKNMDKM
tara:strand:- start:830 stop:1462 length:633 start_codon:yes stop_codon:yes gene_type:complete